MLQQIESISELRKEIKRRRGQGERIGFVPTMGFLHEGHISLVEIAQQHSSTVVVSIFVNPTQFNDPKDFDAYPMDIARDSKMLAAAGAQLLFLPTPEIIYGSRMGSAASASSNSGSFQSWVTVDQLSSPWEGAHRPGHFKGVSTVVSILFNIVQADCAVFGEKDFQQLRILEQMVKDLKIDTEVIRGPLVREADGLAMSSRNVRLKPEARKAALSLSRGLLMAQNMCRDGEKNARALIEVAQHESAKESQVQLEYLTVAAESSLQALDRVDQPARLLLAAMVGGVRLIDNVALS